jgi:electron transfer flavoprotein alpha subunit
LDLDEDGNLIQIRPTYGGSIMASIITPNNRPQIASIRPNVMEVILSEQRNIDVEKIVVSLLYEKQRTRWIEIIEKKDSYHDISEANVVIVGGYGMESKENFKLIYKIASLINASPGATRKSVDEGWALEEIQVGQTGKTIAPDIYIACGVSGALQHTIGMKRSKKIIAINQDPAAPIFSMCDVAILGNAPEILKEVYECLVKK